MTMCRQAPARTAVARHIEGFSHGNAVYTPFGLFLPKSKKMRKVPVYGASRSYSARGRGHLVWRMKILKSWSPTRGTAARDELESDIKFGPTTCHCSKKLLPALLRFGPLQNEKKEKRPSPWKTSRHRKTRVTHFGYTNPFWLLLAASKMP